MPVTCTPYANAKFVCDFESEKEPLWPDGCSVYVKSTQRYYILRSGVFDPVGGGDLIFVYLRLNADFSTNSTTAVDVPGLAFTPIANTTHEIQAVVMLRTPNTAHKPRLGLGWSTGLIDGVGHIWETQNATTSDVVFGNVNAPLLVPIGALPNTTQSWPGGMFGLVVVGGAPSGQIRIQLASENAASSVVMREGSFLKFRTII